MTQLITKTTTTDDFVHSSRPIQISKASEIDEIKSLRFGARKCHRKINSTFADHELVKKWQKEEGFIESGISIGFENRKSSNPFQLSLFVKHESDCDSLMLKKFLDEDNVVGCKTGEHLLSRNDRTLLKRYKFNSQLIENYEKQIILYLNEFLAPSDYEIVDYEDDDLLSESSEDWVFLKRNGGTSQGDKYVKKLIFEIPDSIMRSVMHTLCRFYGLQSVTIGNLRKQTCVTVPDRYFNGLGYFFPQHSFCELLSCSEIR